jgi:hypothetical protein
MPGWCDKDPACWLAIVRHWRSDTAYKERNEHREHRKKMLGAPHHQENQSLPQYMDTWVCFC